MINQWNKIDYSAFAFSKNMKLCMKSSDEKVFSDSAFASELFTYSNINKGHFSFRKAYYVITIILQLIGNTVQ